MDIDIIPGERRIRGVFASLNTAIEDAHRRRAGDYVNELLAWKMRLVRAYHGVTAPCSEQGVPDGRR